MSANIGTLPCSVLRTVDNDSGNKIVILQEGANRHENIWRWTCFSQLAIRHGARQGIGMMSILFSQGGWNVMEPVGFGKRFAAVVIDSVLMIAGGSWAGCWEP